MRKLAVIVFLAFNLGGCAALQQLEQAVSIGTTSIANPVTKQRLYQVESAASLIFAGLNTWKKSCEQRLINASCATQIAEVQVYTRKIPPYLQQLREFVKTNDQVNAIVVYNNITKLIGNVKARAAANNIAIGS